MADSLTNYWKLVQPEPGSSRDTWGTKLNNDLAALDTLLQALQPIGSVIDFAGNVAPTGWLLCDGAVKNVADFPRLAAVLGNRYGGNGTTTFAVPDMRGRASFGAGIAHGDQGTTYAFTLGTPVGDGYIAIQRAHLPNYSITTTFAGTHSHPGSVSDVTGNHAHTAATDVQGDHAHSTSLPNLGTGVSGGPYSAMSDVFGYSDRWSSVNGAHWHNVTVAAAGLHQHGLAISSDGNHQHTFNLGGSGSLLRTIPPAMGFTKIICCGPPSMQSLEAANGTPLMASPMRGMH